jgi:uncharacterized protein involved in cysteine biosynthesis
VVKQHGIVAGVSAAFRGLRIATSTPEVGRAYLKLAAVVLALSIVLDVAGIWTVLHFTAGDGDQEWWERVGLVLVRVAGIGIVLLAAPVIAMFISNTLFPFLSEKVFLAGMRAVDPARADQLAAMPGMPLATAVSQNIIRMLLFIALSVGAFAFSFVPVVGSIGGPILQAYFTARALGWELLDPYFEKLEYRFDAQHRFVREHRAPLVGFALPYSLVMAIPILGPFAFGIAQAAAGVFTREILETPPPQE